MTKKQKDYYAIIGLSFGTGISNKYLSEVVKIIRKDYPRIIPILQKEIASWLFLDRRLLKYVISKHRKKGKYLDTIEVLEQAKEICGNNKKVILIAHPDHLPRCILTARLLGFEPAEGRVPKDIPYDNSSFNTQWWTKSKLRFMFWEFIAYLWLFLKIKLKKNE